MPSTDTDDLSRQYATSANLEARIRLHRLYSTNKEEWTAWVFRQMTLPNGGFILELGCGNGQLWLDNLQSVPPGATITLSDLSPGMLSAARDRLSGSSADFKYMVIDAQRIPMADESVDAVIANHMLYHVPNLNAALSEIRRVLKPNGAAYCTTFGSGNLLEIEQLLEKIDPRIVFQNVKDCPITLQNGSKALSPHFKHVEVREYVDSLRVTDANDLMKYLLSSGGLGNICTYLVGDKASDLKEIFLHEIREKGCVAIKKEAGMLIGRKTA